MRTTGKNGHRAPRVLEGLAMIFDLRGLPAPPAPRPGRLQRGRRRCGFRLGLGGRGHQLRLDGPPAAPRPILNPP